MYRRLYFLFPSMDHMQSVVDELMRLGVSQENIHVVANDNVDVRKLPAASSRQRQDRAHQLEHIAWRINLAVFGVALLLLIYFSFTQHTQQAILMLLIMLLTFVLGLIWSKVPDTELSEFRYPLQHNEILLMIDVPKKRLFEVSEKVHRQYPEAVAGGSSWSVQSFYL